MRKAAIGFVVILGIVTLIAWSVLAIVPPGHVGVLVMLGKVDANHVPEGLSFKNPIARLAFMSVRTQTLTMAHGQHGGAVEALTADGLMVHLDITVSHKLQDATAPWVYRNLGTDYVNSIVIPEEMMNMRQQGGRGKLSSSPPCPW